MTITSRAQRLIEEFEEGHLGIEHGLAKVLMHLAYAHDDPESFHAVPRFTLEHLAKELTADLFVLHPNSKS